MDLTSFQESNNISLPEILLKEALTHPSHKFVDADAANFERLETLGDAVLDLVVTEDLVHNYSELDPGGITRKRSVLVKNSTLAKLARDLEIAPLIIAAPQYKITKGDLANVIEALFGALFIHGGYLAARSWYLHIHQQLWKYVGDTVVNSIGKLQEFAQKNKIELPKYNTLKSGSDHRPDFQSNVTLVYNNQIFKGEGMGKSKQESKENAANQLLRKLDSILNTP